MLFRLEGVTLARGGEPVLRDLDAELPEGTTCVVGPSGCGKSTLLRLLNRLADPDQGVVRYRGTDVRERDPLQLRREVCLVPQLPALLDGTVADNVRFAADLAGREPEIDRVLGLAGLDPSYRDRVTDRLSVGERQRAMLARALAVEPRVLLLDEPTSALDADAAGAVEETLGELRDRLDASIVIVTHDPAQARRLAGWALRMETGRVVASGPARELVAA